MAVKLVANYAKRLGLPGYSSHQFTVSVETELVDMGDVQGEAARLYNLLQDAVDREIQQVGFVPEGEYGAANGKGTPSATASGNGGNDHWVCSDKQKELIVKLVNEHQLDRNEVDQLAHERFGVGVKQLNKLQASGFISELLENSNTGKRNGAPPRKAKVFYRGGGR